MDPEILAMSEIAKALEPLSDDARRRVLSYVLERYPMGMNGKSAVRDTPKHDHAASAPQLAPQARTPFGSFPELFDAANPQTGLDKVLLAGYWFQILQSQEDWESQSINTELKHMGHPSSNITRDLDSLIKRTPRLVLQVRKDGTTRQARKRYKLTREGTKAVESMLENGGTAAGVA